MMNPFKWIARVILRKELSASAARLAEQELIITRLRNSSDAREVGKLHVQIDLHQQRGDKLRAAIDAALLVHDSAKAPNATVKRMARRLREPREVERDGPDFPPIWIIANTKAEATKLHKRIGKTANIAIKTPILSDIIGGAPALIIVLPSVDLQQDIGGEGRLYDLLSKRQITWGDRASMVVL